MKHTEAQLSTIMKLTDSATGSPDADLQKAINDIKKNAKQIFELAKTKITSYQKELDKIALTLEEGVDKKGLIGQGINAVVIRPVVRFLKSLVTLNPDQVAEQLSENPIFNIYDLLDNANIIPEGSPFLQTISNFYDWVQVYNDIKPFILKKETDPYHYIEAATDLIFALKESTIAGQIPSLDVLNTSLMSAYIFSKAGAPTARYLGNPKGGLKLFGFEPEKDNTKITKYFEDYQNEVNKEINKAIIEGNTKVFEILNILGKKFAWVKSFSNKKDLTANEMYLMENTKDVIFNRLKIYNTILSTFKRFDYVQRWPIIKKQLNWDSLPQQDKEFVNSLIENFKKTNLR